MKNYDLFKQIVKNIINHDDNAKFKNILQKRFDNLTTKKTNLKKAKNYLDLTDVKDPSFLNKADDQTINLISTEINKINNYDNLANNVKKIINHNDNVDLKNSLNKKLRKLKIKKANLEKAKVYFDLNDVKDSSFLNKVDDQAINLISTEINKINNYDNLANDVKKIINHNDNSDLKNSLNKKLRKLQTKKANLEAAKVYFDLNDVKDPSFFNKADDQTINLISTEINKINNYDNLTSDVKKIIYHNDNSDLKNSFNIRFRKLKIKKANLEKAKNYFNLNIKNPSLFNRATTKGIELITKEINKNTFVSLSQEIKKIINHNDNLTKKNNLTNKFNALKTKKTNLEAAKRYFNYFEPKLLFFNDNFEFLLEKIEEKLSKTHLSKEANEIIEHSENSDLEKKWYIGLYNWTLQRCNQRILNVFKKQNVLIDFRRKDSGLFKIFILPYKAFNQDIEKTIEKQSDLKLKKLLWKEFSIYKKNQKEILKQISFLETKILFKSSLEVDYIDHHFVFKNYLKNEFDFVIIGIKSLVKTLILQSIVKSPFYPLTPEEFEEKLINVSDKKIFFINWKQAKQKWLLDRTKKTFIQSNNHLLNSHSQNNLFIKPNFILVFFVIIFCFNFFIKWIKKLWKN